MSYDRAFATTWQLLLDAICTLMGLGADRDPPVVLSSLPDLPYPVKGRAPLSFIQGPRAATSRSPSGCARRCQRRP
jgi:hypothetical protein